MCVRLQSLVWGGFKFRIVFAGSISFKQRDYTLSKSCAKFVVKGTQAVQRKESELNKIMQLLFHWAVMWNNTSYMLIKHMALLGIKHGLLLLLLYEIKKKVTWFWMHPKAAIVCGCSKKREGKKIICKCKNRDCPHLFFFPLPLLFPSLQPFPVPRLPLLKAITEIQFLIPPHRSSIDCKQIYIQAVNRKLQRFI